jgi:hypothetical protein
MVGLSNAVFFKLGCGATAPHQFISIKIRAYTKRKKKGN